VANLQVTCDLGTINSGTQARVTIVATLIQPGSVANYAQTWGPYDPDPDPNDNDAVVSTTVRPQANTTYVQVTGSGFNPRLVTIKPGTTVQWNFLQGTHSATDNTGMGLFGSGFRNSVDYFRFTFFAAGTYDVVDQVIPNNTSVVEVVTKASPKRGDLNTRFRIVWSTMFPPAGYAFDVEIRRPGSQGYVDYLVGTTLRNTNFVPDAGPGRYSFRAELRNTVNGAATRPSPSVTIRC
jgi:plastocyanin